MGPHSDVDFEGQRFSSVWAPLAAFTHNDIILCVLTLCGLSLGVCMLKVVKGSQYDDIFLKFLHNGSPSLTPADRLSGPVPCVCAAVLCLSVQHVVVVAGVPDRPLVAMGPHDCEGEEAIRDPLRNGTADIWDNRWEKGCHIRVPVWVRDTGKLSDLEDRDGTYCLLTFT